MTPESGGLDHCEISPWRSRRLWSLWDVMRPLRLTNLLIAAVSGGMYYVQGNVNKVYPSKRACNDALDRSTEDEYLKALEEHCVDLELVASLATIRKMQRILSEPNPSHSAMGPLRVEFQQRLLDEMNGKILWSMTAKEYKLYSSPRKGWEIIIDRFPDSVIDVEEAYKCFALSRYAAAVFHSVQVVEVGLIELGKIIGVTDPLSGWTATTNRLHGIIKKGHDARTIFERDHFPFLEQIHGTIEALKNAWRNKVSHAHGKLTLMTADFSPDFMRRLATDVPLPELPS
jgi:hypothetical protein